MNQKLELNAFMQEIQRYLKKYSSITLEAVYERFKEYGLDESEKNKSISDNSKKEITDMLYSKTSEGKCSYDYSPIDEGWNFFRTNCNDGSTKNYKWKVYIPIKMEHYGFVVKNIISFLCDNGIISESKVSGTMRSDSLIVNLQNEEDVTKINQFIDSNISLKKCLGAHNPFIPDFNGIGVVHGYDTDLSFTERLSGYLAYYADVCKENGRLDLITPIAFLETMKESLYNGNVKKPKEIEQIIEHMDVIMNGKWFSDDEYQPIKR